MLPDAVLHTLFLADTVQRLEQVFQSFDRDHNGRLDSKELCTTLRSLMLPCTEKDIDILLGGSDGGIAGLDEAHFAKYCFLAEQYLWDIYKQMHTEKSGISQEQFSSSMVALGYTSREADKLFRTIELGKAGRLSYLEWRKLLANASPEGKAWVDAFHCSQLTSDSILGDNLRPARARGDARLVDLMAGFVAGVVSRTLTAPAERVKTEMQVTEGSQSIAATCRRILFQQGTRGFFQGNVVNCIKVAPQSSMFFAMTDYLKASLPTRGDPARSSLHSFLSGTGAGVVSQFIIYPLEPIKTCLTIAPEGRYKGMLDCGRQLVRSAGVSALYRGATPTLAGAIPYAGIQRLAYDWLQTQYTRYSKSDRPSVVAGFNCGLLSSTLGMTVSYPLVVVRTRLQVQGSAVATTVAYSGVADCLHKTFAREGFKGLFKGFLPNLVKGVPAAAINFAMYDYVKDALKQL
eukprot:gnl/TRDRNA2_/TRDRNA2_34042_c0_seq1.p1 gnl/TRDRNA2_/TRDRNA2_34042_c0~~gnl/TRDRNA2_/TRDRNA2_34042_c0_seq1.p1  ORF type:complete len:461 (+),score=48.96 gnl/TRDRNA2_/TRDRNA2_34042_c0_seq1:68-1450(+)